MLENFDVIKMYHKHLMFGSEKHPRIDWQRAIYHIEIINNTTSMLQ